MCFDSTAVNSKPPWRSVKATVCRMKTESRQSFLFAIRYPSERQEERGTCPAFCSGRLAHALDDHRLQHDWLVGLVLAAARHQRDLGYDLLAFHHLTEIGRASCRGRG